MQSHKWVTPLIKIQVTKKRIILKWESPCIFWLWLFVGYENQYSDSPDGVEAVGAVGAVGTAGSVGILRDVGTVRAMGTLGTLGTVRAVWILDTVRAEGTVRTLGTVRVAGTLATLCTVRAEGTLGTRSDVITEESSVWVWFWTKEADSLFRLFVMKVRTRIRTTHWLRRRWLKMGGVSTLPTWLMGKSRHLYYINVWFSLLYNYRVFPW